MNNFAKLYETKFGQILCVLDMRGNDGPEMAFTVKPPGFGLCSTTLSFTDEEGAQQCFDRMTVGMAIEAVEEMVGLLGGIS